MALVIFFRAANVGGHQVFKPGELAKKLKHLDVVNIGAAGTFVVRGKGAVASVKTAVLAELSFQPEMYIFQGRDVLELANSKPFEKPPPGDDITRYVTILQKAPRTPVSLPLELPVDGPWEVKFFAMSGPFLLSYQRPGKKKLYPNAVAEKQVGVPATTRNWNTIVAIGKILEG